VSTVYEYLFLKYEQEKSGNLRYISRRGTDAMNKATITETMIPILDRNSVTRAAFFGSFARGEGTEDSDIDLLVEFEKGKSLLDLVGLKIELEEALGRKIDVITYNSINPLLKDSILKEQVVFYEKAS
jgi:uncharacterized protein